MEFIAQHNLTGILTGICTFLIIGIYHPIVIKCEYYFGVRCWWVFLLTGIAGIASALLIRDTLYSALLSVWGFSSFWAILELFEQDKRVKKGWFPKNPNRKAK
jgi:hypothetical protein